MTESVGATSPSVQAADTSAVVEAEAAAAAPSVVIEVPLPAPGETVRIALDGGQAVHFAFDLAAARSTPDGQDLVLEVNGGTVVLEGFETAMAGEAAITNADGEVVNFADFLVAIGMSPEAMEPAAGPAAAAQTGSSANQGAGFTPGQAPTILASLEAHGAISPSGLSYRVPTLEQTSLDLEDPDLANGQLGSSIDTTVEGGEGGQELADPNAVLGEFTGGFEDWAANQHVGDYSSAPMKLNVSLQAADNEEIVSLTIKDIPDGVVIFTPAGIVVGDGANSVTIPAADLGDVYVLPPANHDGDIQLQLEAQIIDPDSGLTGKVEGEVTAVVDAAADAPADLQVDAPTEVGLGTEVSFEVQAQFGDWGDGSEAHFLLVEMPAGWSDPSGAYETETFAAGNGWNIPEGTYVRVPATVDPATGIGSATVTLQAPSSLPADSSAQTYQFGVVGKAVETAADGELTGANNVSYSPLGDHSQLAEIPVTVNKPRLTIDDVQVDEDAGTATFTVTLHGATGVAVAVGYATGDGSAADGLGEAGAGIPDYASTTGSLTFPASSDAVQTITVTVPITDDSVFETPESFVVDLVGADPTIVDMAGSDLQGVGAIVDNDPLPAISISDGTPTPQAEPGEAGDAPTKVSFTVTLSNPSSQAVTVAYQTAGGSALEGIDFENASGTLTFAPGETSKVIEIDVLGDNIDELLESFTVELSAPGNATIADGAGVGQIADTDPTPVLTISDSSASEGGRLEFTLSLSNPSSGEIVLDLAAGAPGSAAPGADYETANFQYFDGTHWVAAGGPDGTQVRIPAGETSLKVRIDTHEDWTDEPNETLTLSATPAAGSADVDASDTATGTIVDDDKTPELTILDSLTVEGAPMGFVLALSNPSSGDIVLDLSAGTPGAGAPGVDYETVSFEYFNGSSWVAAGGPNGTEVTIPAGELGLLVRIDTHEDNIHEGFESLTLSATPTGDSAPVVATDTATGLIIDDDHKPVLTIGNASAGEGEGLEFTLSLSNPSAEDIILNLTAGNPGSASAGADYETVSFEYFDGTNWVAAGGADGRQVTLQAGQTTLLVRVDSQEDLTYEGNETFTLSASKAPGSGDVVTGDEGLGTILDDDPLPAISISDGTPLVVAEPGASGDAPTKVSFTVTLSSPSSQAVSVAYQTVGGSALEGVDFENEQGVITFAPGETSKVIEIEVYGDDIDEALEGFTVELSSPTNATIADGAGSGQIQDTDPAPTLTIADASAAEGAGLAFSLSLSNPSSGDIVLDLAAGAPGSAAAGADYETGGFEYFDGTAWQPAGGPNGTQVTIAAGETSLMVRVASHEDLTYEGNESFTLSATKAAGSADVVTGDTATGTILDDDPMPTLAINDVQVVEGDPIGGNDDPGTYVTFTVTKGGATAETVTVQYGVVDGTATTPGDYLGGGGASPLSGTLTFAPGETSKTITLRIGDDLAVEDTETFSVVLSDPVNATIADSTGVGTIVDNDVNVPDAVDDHAETVEGLAMNYQLMLVVDRSESMMEDPDGPGGYGTRLELAVASLKNLIDTYVASTDGSVEIKIVQFADSASYLAGSNGSFVDAATAKAALNNLTTDWYTDYDSAVAVAANGIADPSWVASNANTQGLVYFLSDGQPTGGDGFWPFFWNPNDIDGSEEKAWQQTLQSKGVQAIAVGVGAGIAGSSGEEALGTVAFTPSGGGYADSDAPVIIVTDESQLSSSLAETVSGVLTGNVISNDEGGPDGFPGAPGQTITSVQLAAGGTLLSSATSGKELTLVTTNGTLTINLVTGDYQYVAKPGSSGGFDKFLYIVQDAVGGESDSAYLTIDIGYRITIAESAAEQDATGSDAGDIIIGNSLANILDGGDGDDVIYGMGGNDNLTGGDGADTFGFVLGDQGAPAAPVTNTYSFDGATRANDIAQAYEFEVGSFDFANLNALDPSANAGYIAGTLNEATDAQYEDLASSDNNWFKPHDPANGSSQVMWFQFNLTEDPAEITEISITVEGRQSGSASSGEEAVLGIWNHLTGDWEVLASKKDDMSGDGDWTATLDSNLASYVDGAGHLTLAFLNEDKSGWLRVDNVEVDVTSVGAPSTVDTITDFTVGAGGDVLDLNDLLPAAVDNSTSPNVLDDYLRFEKDGDNTNILIDHDGGGSFKPDLQLVLEGVDLTANSSLTDAQIIQTLIDNGNLAV